MASGLPRRRPQLLAEAVPQDSPTLVPISREMIQLTGQLPRGSSVAPPHRALLLELELAAS